MNYFLWIILFISSLLWIYRITPYFSSNIPLWYDPGIFRAYFLDYFANLPNIDLYNLDTWVKQIYEPGLGFLTNILLLIWYDVDFIIGFWLVFFSLVTWFFLYLVLKENSKVTAILWLSMYFISIVQYKAFWWNYYKQIIWILFLFTTIYLFQKKKYILAIPSMISMFIINRASGVFFVLMFIFYKIYEIFLEKKINFKDIIIVWIAWLLALWIYFPILQYQLLDLIKPLATTIMTEWKSGTFFSREEFWFVDIFFIVLAFGWIYITINKLILEKKKLNLVDFWFIIWMLWTSLGLFFYNRFYIFFDLFLIVFASYFLYFWYEKNKKVFVVLTSIFFVSQSLFYFNYVKENSNTLISQKEFDKIQEISKLIEDDAVIMVTHKNYSPWLIWYTRKKIIAPGLFDWNKWSLENWIEWWSKSDWAKKCEMLKDYSEYKHLYLWIWERQPKENLKNANCLEEVFLDENFKFYKINQIWTN